MKNVFFLIAFLSASVLLTISCKKEYVDGTTPDLPTNPYSTIKYPTNIGAVTIDSNSFVGIHKYIFAAKCAMPGCHDGAFEPDFRTVQSAYNTLVLQPVKKNNTAQSFVYRVKPYDATLSWLHERVLTNDSVLGRMPLYDNMLAASQIQKITNWINAGAPDVFGNVAGLPNAPPQTFGIVATIPNGSNPIYRIDTIRNGSPFMPFLVPNNTLLTIWFGLYDDTETPSQFTFNKIKFTTNPTDFSTPNYQNLNFNSTAVWMDNLFGTHKPYFYSFTINTNQFTAGIPVYMRIYTKDSQHSSPTEIPSSGLEFYLQSYFSFVVAP
ncbi:MAG: hypothetical protein RJA07_2459 [Bacteroidota bacterium]|jgi:hypothetical protein